MAQTFYSANLALLRDVVAADSPYSEPDDDGEAIVDRWYVGSFTHLDPCGRYHHTTSPNGVGNRCIDFWVALDRAAEALDGAISSGEGDPTDVFFERRRAETEAEALAAAEAFEAEALEAAGEDDAALSCTFCGGPWIALGSLGRVAHFRCRDCGLDGSVDNADLARDVDRAIAGS